MPDDTPLVRLEQLDLPAIGERAKYLLALGEREGSGGVDGWLLAEAAETVFTLVKVLEQFARKERPDA